MTQEILFQEGAIEVGALVLARGLGLDVASLHEFMREGKITNLRERGVDNDLALHRPTFFNGNRRLRLDVGQAGTSSGSQRSTSATTLCPPECTNPGRNRVADHVPGFLSCMLGEGKASILSCR